MNAPRHHSLLQSLHLSYVRTILRSPYGVETQSPTVKAQTKGIMGCHDEYVKRNGDRKLYSGSTKRLLCRHDPGCESGIFIG